MTPLQAIAASEFVKPNSDAISPHVMAALMQEYASNPLTAAFNQVLMDAIQEIENDDSILDADKPAAIEAVRAAFISEVGALPGNIPDLSWSFITGTTNPASPQSTLSGAINEYCDYVLCSGDVGKFSQVIDKVSGFSAATGEVYNVMEKASAMKFSDFGPGVTNHIEASNMGIGAMIASITSSFPASTSNHGPAQLAAAITNQGAIAGTPNDPTFGTAVGIYDMAVRKGLEEELLAIHTIFVKDIGVEMSVTIQTVSSKYAIFSAQTTATVAEINAELDKLEKKATSDATSPDSFTASNAAALLASMPRLRSNAATWTERRSANAITMLSNPSYRDSDASGVPYLLENSVRIESKMVRAIDSLSLETATSLFRKLGSTVQVDKLTKNTDILDLAKVATAQAAPIPANAMPNNDIVTLPPSVVASTADAIVTPPPDAIPQVSKSSTVSVGSSITSAANSINSGITSATSSVTSSITGMASQVTGNVASKIAVAAGKVATNVINKAVGSVTGAISGAASAVNSAISAVGNLASAVASLPTKLSSIGDKFAQVKGFSNVGSPAALAGMLRSVETTLPVSAKTLKSMLAQLSSFTEVMPASVVGNFKSVVGTGSSPDGSYKVSDFLGSVVGMNGQAEQWANVTSTLTAIYNEHSEELDALTSTGSGITRITGLGVFWARYKAEPDAIYSKVMSNFDKEWQLLTVKAEVDFTKLKPGSIIAAIGFSNKLAQHASKLDSGLAAILQKAANPALVAGQSLLAVMVEARNTKAMHAAGFDPINNIVKKNPIPGIEAAVTDADRTAAAKLQAEGGNIAASSPEEVARNRAIEASKA